MSEKQNRNFVMYEYKELSAVGEKASSVINLYENFGWQIDKQENSINSKMIILKRNRKIVNRAELTRLQSNMEACFNEIQMLQKSKKAKANMISLAIGLLGTAFIAGSVFAITAADPILWLCVVLAVPAFALWATIPLLRPRLIQKRTKIANELIEKKYDEIYEICEKGNKLLL